MMYNVSPELYLEVLARLCDAIDGENYFSGTIAFRFGGGSRGAAAPAEAGDGRIIHTAGCGGAEPAVPVAGGSLQDVVGEARPVGAVRADACGPVSSGFGCMRSANASDPGVAAVVPVSVLRTEGVDCRLTASVIVYRKRRSRPEGVDDAISDLVPVWWEFHTSDTDGELLNDFSFSDLRRCL